MTWKYNKTQTAKYIAMLKKGTSKKKWSKSDVKGKVLPTSALALRYQKLTPGFTYEYSSAPIEVSSTIQFINLSDSISQGTDINDRTRDIIAYKNMKGTISCIRPSGSTAGQSESMRVVIFQWHPDNLVDAPSILNHVLWDQTTGTHLRWFNCSTYDRIGIPTLHGKKLTTLVDIRFRTTFDGSQSDMFRRKFFISGKKLRKVTYNAGLTSGKNHVYMMIYGESATGNANCHDLTYYIDSPFNNTN